MRFLITGASGYIGTALVAHLVNEGHEVYGVTRSPSRTLHPGAKWIALDFIEDGWTERLPDDVDLVIHLAQSRRHRELPPAIADLVRVNILATSELAEWARTHGVRRFVFASTGTVYGYSASASKENDATDPQTAYAATKLSAELILRQYARHFDVMMLRIFGVYGPGRCSSIFARLPQMMIDKQPITLAGGVGLQLNPIYIDDCVAMISALAITNEAGSSEIINVGGRELVCLANAVNVLEKALNIEADVRTTSDNPVRLIGSVDKMMKLVGDKLFVTLERGLQNVVASREGNSVA
jgi:UDP-glucose 4-epimerase